MRTKLPFLTSVAVILTALLGSSSAARMQSAPAPQAPDSAYAWAGACKSCHKDIYDAWANTKHARALDRLSGDDQQKECIGCHVTGPKTRVEEKGKVLNAGVQCEACHGAAGAHAADPTIKTGLVRKPPERTCVDCHNDRSPRFKGFVYGPMLDFSHRVPK